MKPILVLSMILTVVCACAQAQGQMSMTDFINRIEQGQSTFKDKQVVFDIQSDIGLLDRNRIRVKAGGDLNLGNCSLSLPDSVVLDITLGSDSWAQFDSTTVDCYLLKLVGPTLIFNSSQFNCRFKYQYVGADMRSFVRFNKSNFNSIVEIQNIQMNVEGNVVRFEDCVFDDSHHLKFPSYRANQEQLVVNGDFRRLFINGCSFSKSVMPSLTLRNAILKTLDIEYSDLKSIDFTRASVSTSISFKDSELTEALVLKEFTFPAQGTHLSWEHVKGNKIRYSVQDSSARVYDVRAMGQYRYEELMSSYNKLYRMYRERGDRASGNGCYAEMKSRETERLAYLVQNGSSNLRLELMLNLFMSYFTDYGTNPIKALKISGYIILLFACFYFFTYSEWDKVNRRFLVEKHQRLLQYFQTESTLSQLYGNEPSISRPETARKDVLDIPPVIRLVGKALLAFSGKGGDLLRWALARLEMTKVPWEELKKPQKRRVSFKATVVLMGYLIFLILIRSLNSTFLSLNTFSTLGFGDIPVKGLARYLAILEGFMGWFLLSIFSVSLIGQLLFY